MSFMTINTNLKLFRSDFSKNVVTLISGTAFAQAIPILLSPLLTRLYKPEEFGTLALFLSVSTILASFINGRYEVSIVLPNDEQDAINLVRISIFISIIFLIPISLVLFIFNDSIARLLNDNNLSSWLYLVPFSVFLISLFNILKSFAQRYKRFKQISYATIGKSLASTSIQAVLGLFSFNFGLLLGNFASYIVGNFQLLKFYINKPKQSFYLSSAINLAKRYIDFPKYDVLSTLLNQLSIQLPVLILSIYYSSSVVGFFSFGTRMLTLPIALVGVAFSNVFYIEANALKNEPNELAILIEKLILKVFYLSLIPFALISIYGDLIFSFAFGRQWIVAGQFAQYLSPYLLLVFLYSPVVSILFVLNKQSKNMLFNILLIISRLIILLICAIHLFDVKILVISYSAIGVIYSFVFFIYLIKISNVKLSVLFRIVIVYSLTCLALYVTRLLLLS